MTWAEYDCAESNNHVQIGKEYYFLSADGYLMPTLARISRPRTPAISRLRSSGESDMIKRVLAALLLALLSGAAHAEFNVVEASIAEMQQAMASGRVTSRELVSAVPDAHRALRQEAQRRRDRQSQCAAARPRRAIANARKGRVRGPLHGIPIALKDNIHTTDMPTTGGALAFDGFVPPYEATLVKNLRDAGAMIIAKTGMTELANWMAGPPTPMPAGYNAGRRLRHEPVRSAARSARPDIRRPSGAAAGRIELGHRHRCEFVGRERRHRDLRLASSAPPT